MIKKIAIRGLMHEAALQDRADPDRLSFVHAVRGVRRNLPRFVAMPFLASRRLHTRCLSDWSSDVCSSDLDLFFSSRRRHTRCLSDWSSDVCSSDLVSVKGSFTEAGRVKLLRRLFF